MYNQGLSLDKFIEKQDLSVPLSTAQGVREVPFQRWFHFKEAFSPKFVIDVIKKSGIEVNSLLDPFGGSGTSALTAQMHGIRPTTIEVNPFLADLIESKLTHYDLDQVIDDWISVVKNVNSYEPELEKIYANAPSTLYCKKETERWIFNKDILTRIAQFRLAIEDLENESSKRLLKVLLGAILIPLSNVLISGKGRRYRKNWQVNSLSVRTVDMMFEERVNQAIFDISRYSSRQYPGYHLLRGDSRKLIENVHESDLVLFSPPYPNTFDYTDIYNVELWTLGYLNDAGSNRNLRIDTLRSHVQIKTDFSRPPESELLENTLKQISSHRDKLWNKNIPEMVGAYFSDIQKILSESSRLVHDAGMVVIVIGDSRYVNVRIDTANITKEISESLGLELVDREKIRVMKSSAQQGWANDLEETALYFRKN